MQEIVNQNKYLIFLLKELVISNPEVIKTTAAHEELKRPVFVAMKTYAPSAGAPAMFLGVPVIVVTKRNQQTVLRVHLLKN